MQTILLMIPIVLFFFLGGEGIDCDLHGQLVDKT